MANPETGTETMKKKKAAGLTAAQQNQLPLESYPKAGSESTLELLIGGLLLFGNAERRAFWPLFDVLLRQYIDLRISGGKHES
jgi:hypothetical protein